MRSPCRASGLGTFCRKAFALACAIAVLATVVARPVAAVTFTVDSTGEAPDAVPGDGACADASNNCTLPAAIQEVNAYATGAPHTIAFADTATSFQFTIELPQIIRQGTVIDGWSPSTWSSGGPPVVVLSGESAGFSLGLRIGGDDITIRGLQIYSFQRSGIAVEVGTTGAIIRGCYIGTNGTTDLGNGDLGIYLGRTSGNMIGGTGPDDGNVISGNTNAGIRIDGSGGTAANNTILGNLIGLDATGTAAIPNAAVGVEIMQADTNLVGGASAAARNVISGNGIAGVAVLSGATNNVIQGNYIGTDSSGSAAVPNENGVNLLQGAVGTLIGGAGGGEGNLISGNTNTGITVTGSSTATSVFGNLIGLDAAGTGTLGNGTHGIYVFSAPDVLIGGAGPGQSNRIAFNGGSGVVVREPAPCIIKRISANSIHDNSGLGIDLGEDGVTANDPGDPDLGPNNLQNFPVLTAATSGGGQTGVSGSLNSTASTSFQVEFFASPLCDPSGYGEGEVYLGGTDVMTDVAGDAPFDVTLTGNVNPNWAISATATDPSGNTSEFSACQVVARQGVVIPVLSTSGLVAFMLLLAGMAILFLKGKRQ